MNRERYLKGTGSSLAEKLILLLMIVIPLLLIRQGLDFTDTGYMLTNYQQIFNDPDSISASFRIWMTNVIGGIWIYLFGDSLGLLGYRFAGVLAVYATLYLSYLTLRPFLERKHLLPGLFLALIFINRLGYQLNYNTLTALFNVLGAYLAVRGLLQRKKGLIFLAGLVLGINIFVRLPNILSFALITAIIFYGIVEKTSVSEWLAQTAFFSAGYLTAILAVSALMYGLGQLDSYLSAFKDTFFMLRDPVGHHRWDYVVNNYLEHHKNIFVKTGALVLGFYAFTRVLTLSAKLGKRLLQYGIILAAAAAMLYLSWDYLQNWVHLVITVMGILYIVLISVIFGFFKPRRGEGDRANKGTNGFRLVSFVSLILLVLTPLGSNIPIWNAVYGMYLAIPLVSGLTMSAGSGRAEGSGAGLKKDEIKLITAISLGVCFILTLNLTYHFTYRDSEDRTMMRSRVDHRLLRGVLTTGERARVVQELVDVLPRYVKEDDYLLAYEQISMVYYLTKTRPYLYSAWPMLYSPEQFKGALERAQKERPYLPVIVRATGNTEERTWPRPGKQLRSPYHNAAREIMNDFITENGYKVVWRNDFFEVLITGR